MLDLLRSTLEEVKSAKADTIKDKSLENVDDLLTSCAEYDRDVSTVVALIQKLSVAADSLPSGRA